ncbi:MAG: hypothetical protein U0169_16230 [Polyangiaceae bacterium]
MAALVVILWPVLLYVVASRTVSSERTTRIFGYVLAAYALRILAAAFVVREFAFFSHGVAGGDSKVYEFTANEIAALWRANGVSFISEGSFTLLFDIRQVALHVNLLGLVSYVTDGSMVAMASVLAFCAGGTGLALHRFCRDLGATEVGAERAMLLVLFSPSFVFHTSDTYKDGLNALLVLVAVALASRIARKPRVFEIALLLPTLWALWYVRRYMVFMCAVPLVFGVLNPERGSIVRTLLISAVIVVVAALGSSSLISSEAGETAMALFDRGTDSTVMSWNARGGSGVVIEGDGAGSIGLKLIYTLFSPFLWAGGSFGMHVGKIDTVIWYYTLFHAWRTLRDYWSTKRKDLLPLLVFAIPATYAYALSFSNVGLIFRQRLPIVIIITAIASVSWSHVAEATPARIPLRRRPSAPPSPSLAPRLSRRRG